MRESQRDDRVADAALGNHRLDPQLGEALLPPALAERRTRPFAAEERARAGRVPRAALIGPDPSSAGLEHGVAGGIERLLGHEPDELDLAHSALSICARWRVPE